MPTIWGSDAIVTDGLVIYLDAANPRSYPGTGSTWYNLSKKLGDATIVGSLPFTGSSFVPSSNSTYASINYTSSLADFSYGQTICAWIKPLSGATPARRNFYNQAFGGPGTITQESNYSFNYYFGTAGSNTTPYTQRSSNFTVLPNELAFVCVTRDQILNQVGWYKNGVRISVYSSSYTTTANGTSAILIGVGYTSYFAGDIYNCMVYTRGLTEAEVAQNYNALRKRFGV